MRKPRSFSFGGFGSSRNPVPWARQPGAFLPVNHEPGHAARPPLGSGTAPSDTTVPIDGDLYGYRGRAQAITAARALWDGADPMQRRLALADDTRTVPGAPPIEKRNLTQEAQLATAHSLLQTAQNAADQPAQQVAQQLAQNQADPAEKPIRAPWPLSSLPRFTPPSPAAAAAAAVDANRQDEERTSNWEAYLNTLIARESDDDPSATNMTAGGIGAHGLAQLRGPALQDAGYIDKDGNWTNLDGADSLATYQAQADIQRQSAARLAHVQNRYIEDRELDKYVGATMNIGGHPVTLSRAALFAATHYAGAKGLKEYFDLIQREGDSADFKPNAHHQEIEKRIELFENVPFDLPILPD